MTQSVVMKKHDYLTTHSWFMSSLCFIGGLMPCNPFGSLPHLMPDLSEFALQKKKKKMKKEKLATLEHGGMSSITLA